MPTLGAFLTDVRACTRCAPHLPHGVQPVFQFHPSAPILIAGQAPGARVHASGVPFDDASGARLRAWLGVDRDTFYDPTRIAILPMGFCYPGTGKSGDLPLRPECAPRLARSLHAAFRAPVAGQRIGISNGLVCEKPGKPDSALGGQPMPAWMAWNWRLSRCLVWIRPALTARLALVGP